jgi:hypothetical protein
MPDYTHHRVSFVRPTPGRHIHLPQMEGYYVSLHSRRPHPTTGGPSYEIDFDGYERIHICGIRKLFELSPGIEQLEIKTGCFPSLPHGVSASYLGLYDAHNHLLFTVYIGRLAGPGDTVTFNLAFPITIY